MAALILARVFVHNDESSQSVVAKYGLLPDSIVFDGSKLDARAKELRESGVSPEDGARLLKEEFTSVRALAPQMAAECNASVRVSWALLDEALRRAELEVTTENRLKIAESFLRPIFTTQMQVDRHE